MSDSNARTVAREYVIKALYQWQLTEHSADELCQQFADEMAKLDIVDSDYFQQTVRGIITNISDIDDTINNFASRRVSQLDGVERAILRLGVFELRYQLEIPYRVCINEALELTKRFGSIDGYKFVNAVLDKVAVTHRQSVSD